MKKQKVAKDEEQENSLLDLNYDLIFNIFIKIPADLLQTKLRFQSKQWYQLISSQDFMMANFLASKAGTICIQRVPRKTTFQIKFMEFKEPDSTEVRILRTVDLDLVVTSSCNGLILAEKRCLPYCFYVMNPVTKQSIFFPPCQHEHPIWVELVYVPSTKVYNVVELFHNRNDRTLTLHIQAFDGHSREIQVPAEYASISNQMHNCTKNTHSFNGVLYWTFSSGEHIVAFALHEVEFSLLRRPICSTERHIQRTQLMKMHNFLSVVDFIKDAKEGSHVVIWILKHSYSEEEWVEFLNLDSVQVIGEENFVIECVIGSFNNDQVLVFKNICSGKLGAFDVNTRKWTLINSTEFGYVVHINTLFSLRS